MSEYHAAVWLDHNEARIFHFTIDDFQKSEVHSTESYLKRHIKAGQRGSGKQGENMRYYKEIADALQGAKEILVMGPVNAKYELVKYVLKHHHPIEDAILGVETVDHPTDGQILCFARQYFKVLDRMMAQL